MSQWLLSEREYHQLPYVQNKGEQQDRMLRRECCELIYAVGASIGLPQTTLAVGCIFMHRFFIRSSFETHCPFDIALGCLFIASKSEDSPKRCSAIATAAVALTKDPALDRSILSEKIKKSILAVENSILKQLCFDFDVELAYPYILIWTRTLQVERGAVLKMLQVANDAYLRPECMFYTSKVTALACIRKVAGNVDVSRLPKEVASLLREAEVLKNKL